jgi:hypothetical protein
MLIDAGHLKRRCQPRLMMTDYESETLEVPAADTDSIKRMDQLRAALVADMRHTTAADAKGNRKMVIGALSVLAPSSPLRAKLARCGKRNLANDSREFCRRPCCGVCMQRQARRLFRERRWPALEKVPATHMRWITILTHRCAGLEDGAHEMQRQHRRLQHILSKFAGGTGKSRTHRVRVWGAREVEPIDVGWQFHVHLLIGLDGADAETLAQMLREAWGTGSRQVQIKVLEPRDHRANIIRCAHYMTKARFTRTVGNRREWLSNEDIVTLALWRDRLSAQWHRFTWGIHRS